MEQYIAHISNDVTRVQSNHVHCEGVAQLAKRFADAFGMGEWGYAMGLLHDKGKERSSFQNYIKKTTGYDTNAPYHGEDKAHAYVGALLAKKIYGAFSDMMTNPIAGHHAGLYDWCDLKEVMQKEIPAEVEQEVEKQNLQTEVICKFAHDPQSLHHLYRLLYSCLVDADYLDTERFMDKDSFMQRGNDTTMAQMQEMLQRKINEFKDSPDTPVNSIRRQVQDECLKASAMQPGFFSLTVPTGGGKTISSVVWAVSHALRHGKQRIIIAIPYTSIIVQTAAVLKGIFGEENVLEHHSNADFEKNGDSRLKLQMKLATENWDYPIIVTTNVQLFESMFSNKPSACRKLHNLCNSVLILDEVQTLPTDFLQPIVDALKCYQKHFGLSVLFTTASQPILSGQIQGCNPRATFPGIDNIKEIIPGSMNLHDALRRVKLDINDEGRTYDEIAETIARNDKVLCIVNTRRDAKELYDRLPNEGIKLHLSRMMCPAHIRKTIEDVKQKLKEGVPVIRVIATQLIEAGVDIDFPVVYRQEAGLDSVLQAAGRCNREGKLEICTTYVFSLSKERNLPPGSMCSGNNARKALSNDSDWFAPSTMTEYFKQLYCRCDTFDKKQIAHFLYNPRYLCFEQASDAFNLIDDTGISVIVNWENSMDLVEQLKTEGPSHRLMKALGQYTVCVRQKDFEVLAKAGQIKEILEGIYLVEDRAQYSEQVGLFTDNHWLEEILIK